MPVQDAAMRHVKRIMLSLALISIVLCIPGACLAEDALVKVHGYVYQAGTSSPITDVFLRTDTNYTVFSDSSGYYSLLLPSGFHVITAYVADYVDCSWGVTVNSDEVSRDFYLLPTTGPRYSVSGSVFDEESGELMTGASVLIPSIGYGVIGPGTYSFTLPSGTYEFQVSREGYLTTSANVTIAGSDVVNDFFLTKSNETGTRPDQPGQPNPWSIALLASVVGAAIIVVAAILTSSPRKRP